jgi:hypothetical protein
MKSATAKRPSRRQPRKPEPTNGNHEPSALAADLLRGAPQIAAFLGWPLTRTYHALAAGYVPARKVGVLYIGSKRRLTEHFQGSE